MDVGWDGRLGVGWWIGDFLTCECVSDVASTAHALLQTCGAYVQHSCAHAFGGRNQWTCRCARSASIIYMLAHTIQDAV